MLSYFALCFGCNSAAGEFNGWAEVCARTWAERDRGQARATSHDQLNNGAKYKDIYANIAKHINIYTTCCKVYTGVHKMYTRWIQDIYKIPGDGVAGSPGPARPGPGPVRRARPGRAGPGGPAAAHLAYLLRISRVHLLYSCIYFGIFRKKNSRCWYMFVIFWLFVAIFSLRPSLQRRQMRRRSSQLPASSKWRAHRKCLRKMQRWPNIIK